MAAYRIRSQVCLYAPSVLSWRAPRSSDCIIRVHRASAPTRRYRLSDRQGSARLQKDLFLYPLIPELGGQKKPSERSTLTESYICQLHNENRASNRHTAMQIPVSIGWVSLFKKVFIFIWIGNGRDNLYIIGYLFKLI